MTRHDWVVNSLNVYEQLDSWINSSDSYDNLQDYMSSRVIGQEDISLVCSNVFVYLKTIWRGLQPNNNMIITAPSGTGKTETYRALKDYFKNNVPGLPIFLIDATQLTPSGYRGSNLEDMFAPLLNGPYEEPPAIVFIDEFDKRLMPANAGIDSFNSAVQYNLLSIIEGGTITDTNRRGERGRSINTSKIMFVGLGSFDAYRQEKKTKRGIGFTDVEMIDSYTELTAQTLLEAGATPELMGRFPFVLNYDRLNENTIRKIIQKNIDEFAFLYDCDVRTEPAFIDRLLSLSDSPFGCRAIKNEIQNTLLNVYTKAMGKPHSDNEIILDVILDENESFMWRDYTEEEKKILESLNIPDITPAKNESSN